MKKKFLLPVAWAAGLVMVGVAVLIEPRSERDGGEPARVADPIPIASEAPADPHPSWPELARVHELELKKDDAGLAKIVLASSDPEDKQAARLRVTALYALGNVGTPPALATLRDMLEDRDQGVVYRMAAASALARRGGDAEVAYLRERMAHEPHKLVREKIRLVLNARES